MGARNTHPMGIFTMIYKFKSQAVAEILMLQQNGDQMLNLIGREPSPQGIITVEQAPAAITALEEAIEAYEQAQAQHPDQQPLDNELLEGNFPLRHRAAPFIDLLKRSSEAGQDVVWGV
jgi:cyclopropane-fatty-acyl-phospholipid synthase